MHEVRIQYDLPVVMRDGTVLRADVYSPVGDGPWPAVVIRTPYGKNNLAELVSADPLTGARRGLIVVVQDVRGRSASEGGDWVPGATEGPDGVDTIGWAAELPSASGKVGMWGGSYLGIVQWQAAAEGPPALCAIAPQITFQSFAQGATHRGGAAELGLTRYWGLLMGIESSLRRDDTATGGPRDTAAIIAALDHIGSTFDELPTGTDPVLARFGLPTFLDTPAASGIARIAPAHVDVPSFNVGGWFDTFVQGTLDNFTEHSRHTPSRLLIGPWTHLSWSNRQGDLDFGIAANGANVDLGPSVPNIVYDWLGQCLSDDGPPSDDLPVYLFVMGTNVWRREAGWPLERAVDTRMILGANGRLGLDPDAAPSTVGYDYDPANPVPTLGGNTLLPRPEAGPVDQATVEARDDVLTFTTAPLETDLEVTGRIRARIVASTDGRSTDWVIRLCDVDPVGRSFNIVDGITRARHKPDQPTTVEIDLWSTSTVFRAGHRIRVQVTSSCFPRWDRNPNTDDGFETGSLRVACQTVHVGVASASYIVLPVVPD